MLQDELGAKLGVSQLLLEQPDEASRFPGFSFAFAHIFLQGVVFFADFGYCHVRHYSYLIRRYRNGFESWKKGHDSVLCTVQWNL